MFYTDAGAAVPLENYAPLSEMTMLEGKPLSLVLLIGPLSKVCVGVLSLKSPLLMMFFVYPTACFSEGSYISCSVYNIG